ncbi:hydrolase, NUDIX family protein [Toxoplasma gondii VEG]|uniref:Hydrolase, NUDIX family protein n=1 Tax=Toxoplasma gondii (strain ATCC 50861 / VEG) TaxID=432359 RepID=V4ZC27_TOXGV|nr:hydrolase, NUDIX family protein [Toxoplasma gondii VEG]
MNSVAPEPTVPNGLPATGPRPCASAGHRRLHPVGKTRHVRIEEMHRGDWLKLEKVTYKDATGSRELIWERFVRVTPLHADHTQVTQVPAVSNESSPSFRPEGEVDTDVEAVSDGNKSAAASCLQTLPASAGEENCYCSEAATSQPAGQTGREDVPEQKVLGRTDQHDGWRDEGRMASADGRLETTTDVPQENVEADSVAVVAIAHGGRTSKEDDSSIILVKQYRPAVDAVTVELPGGLVDKGEDVGTAAVRELREETGFVGTVVSVGPKVTQSTLGREELHLVTILVDLEASANVTPRQQLDTEEDIEVVVIPLRDLLQELNRFASEGYTIFDSLYSFAYGLHLQSGLLKNILPPSPQQPSGE